MYRSLIVAAVLLAGCTDPGKIDDGPGGSGSDPTDTGATPPAAVSYSLTFSLASDASIAGEPVTWSGEVRTDDGDAVEAVIDVSSDREALAVDGASLTATVAGDHRILATVTLDDQTLEAEAALSVTPGPAATGNFVLDDPTVEAGTRTTWTFTAEDAWGNPIDPAEPSLVAPALDIGPDGITGTSLGFFDITATLADASDTETLRVVAGAAAVLDLELDDLEPEVGESVTATVSVTDAYGNPSGAPYTLWVEGGRHDVSLDQVTFLEDGTFTVFAQVPSDGPMDSVGPIVLDSSGPELIIVEPPRGAFVDAPDVRVEGTAVDARDDAPPTVATNGVPFVVSPEGAFAGPVPIDDGIVVLETVATDLSGHATTDKRAVLNGSSIPWGDAVLEGLHFRLEDGEGGLDTLETLAEGLIVADDIIAMIPDPVVDEEDESCEYIWPIGDVCFTWYAITLWIDNPRLGETTVDIDPKPTGIVEVELVVADPYMEWSADVVTAEIPISGEGTIEADDFIIRVNLDPRVSDGTIHLDIDNVYVEATNFRFNWESWLSDVAGFFGIDLSGMVEGFVYDALETAVRDEVPAIFEEVLNSLEIAEEFPILDNTYTFEAVPGDVAVDTFGITMIMDTVVTVDDWRGPDDGPGSYYVGYAAPTWVSAGADGTNIALSIDFVNQLLYGMWGGGALSMELSGDELGVGLDDLALLFPEAEGDLIIRIDALLPPVVLPGEGEDLSLLQLGDLRLTLTDEVGLVLLDGYAHGTAPLSISSADGRSFSAEIGDVDLQLDIVEPAEGASDMEDLLVVLVPEFLPMLTDLLVAIELPTIEGFGIADVTVEAMGPEGGYLNLTGNLYEE